MVSIVLTACSADEASPSAGGGGGNSCVSLCKDAAFQGGSEMDFKNGVVECQCTGSGGEVTKPPCEAYCASFGVSAEKALLSAENNVKPDKCVCDGT